MGNNSSARKGSSTWLAITLVLPTVLTIGTFSLVVGASEPVHHQNADTQNASRLEDFDGLVQSVSPAVVSIVSRIQETETGGRRAIPGGPTIVIPGVEVHRVIEASGSGFLINKDGTIITNSHVIGNANTAMVYLADGRELRAHVIGRDQRTDVAVLKLDGKHDLPYVEFGDSDNVRPGQWAIAVGNPFGLGESVTSGIVSARSRAIGNGYYGNFIQVDTPINQGNSGGPLFDKSGHVVGMNTAIFSPTGGSVGIGFAIPSNTVKSIAEQIIRDGHVTRAWLGVDTQALDHTMAAAFGLSPSDKPVGVVIVSVAEDSPASRAGLVPGDVITAYNGAPVEASQRLSQAIGDMKPGTKLVMTVLRDGEEKTVTAELGQAKGDSDAKSEAVAAVHHQGYPKLGVVISKLTSELRNEMSLPDTVHGVIISELETGSPAEMAGLHPGDVILAVGGHPVRNPEEAKAVINTTADARHALALRVFRDGEVVYVPVDMSGKDETQ